MRHFIVDKNRTAQAFSSAFLLGRLRADSMISAGRPEAVCSAGHPDGETVFLHTFTDSTPASGGSIRFGKFELFGAGGANSFQQYHCHCASLTAEAYGVVTNINYKTNGMPASRVCQSFVVPVLPNV